MKVPGFETFNTVLQVPVTGRQTLAVYTHKCATEGEQLEREQFIFPVRNVYHHNFNGWPRLRVLELNVDR